MALQCNVALRGGITHGNAYVRPKIVMVSKRAGVWEAVVEWEGFKDGTEAGAKNPRHLFLSEIDRDKFAFNIDGVNPFAQAYAWAKANKSEFAGATDV